MVLVRSRDGATSCKHNKYSIAAPAVCMVTRLAPGDIFSAQKASRQMPSQCLSGRFFKGTVGLKGRAVNFLKKNYIKVIFPVFALYGQKDQIVFMCRLVFIAAFAKKCIHFCCGENAKTLFLPPWPTGDVSLNRFFRSYLHHDSLLT